MKENKNEKTSWKLCSDCYGQGKKSKRLKKDAKRRYQIALDHYEKNGSSGPAPKRPKASQVKCTTCDGSGLIAAALPPLPDHKTYPHVAIIGGGIGGVALAVACLHRSIPFTLFERDGGFDARSQGYGLTLQQANKAMSGLGISSLNKGVISTRHVVHTTDGTIVGEWGMRKWTAADTKKAPKHTNVHIARQELRLALLEQLGGSNLVRWGHDLVALENSTGNGVQMTFQVDGDIKTTKADLVVGADGIRSAVRRLLIGNVDMPLRYLNCIVILGICSLETLNGFEHDLLDSATVFQTANGHERIYMMPYTANTVMWQLSYPMHEQEAKILSDTGVKALKAEAIKRTHWHDPIPQIVAATPESHISGYPVYDRELLKPELLKNKGSITLIGDAAHPMSPFKGQGANQALLDALALARNISKECRPFSEWQTQGLRKSIITQFESEMLARSASKVKDSAAAAQFLHSDIVLHKADEPRGRCLKYTADS
ncbi:FAD-dependent monooxygenase [Gelidibacter salicanalis]|uniref:FAD-dependent monooxygenase n=1 Tax=Gelidibacter salicanalis TaxID=291193 RepID=A0A5C7ANI9_9FLAO|nr:NAD(P)/FAD-dependent oxidoreductase [Gelidibacter salicanalis]TXE07372.1 FAD-dependent monooxygenase [Gelidibacter salicanalis]